MIPRWWSRPIELGDEGRDVRVVQRKLGGPLTGLYGPETRARVLGYQVALKLAPDGVVGPETATSLGEPSTADLTPLWYERPIHAGMTGEDVKTAIRLLGDNDLDSAVRRLQSANRMTPTGIIDESVALLLGDE